MLAAACTFILINEAIRVINRSYYTQANCAFSFYHNPHRTTGLLRKIILLHFADRLKADSPCVICNKIRAFWKYFDSHSAHTSLTSCFYPDSWVVKAWPWYQWQWWQGAKPWPEYCVGSTRNLNSLLWMTACHRRGSTPDQFAVRTQEGD